MQSVTEPADRTGPMLVLGPRADLNRRLARRLRDLCLPAAPSPAEHGVCADQVVEAAIASRGAADLGGLPRAADVQACCEQVRRAPVTAWLAPGSQDALQFWLSWCEAAKLEPRFLLLLCPPGPIVDLVELIWDLLVLEGISRGRRLVVCPGADDAGTSVSALAGFAGVLDRGADPGLSPAAESVARLLSECAGDSASERRVQPVLAALAEAIRAHDAGAGEGLAAVHALFARWPRSASKRWPMSPDAPETMPDSAAIGRAEALTRAADMERLFERLYAATQTAFGSLTWQVADSAARTVGGLIGLPAPGVRQQIDQLHARFIEAKGRRRALAAAAGLDREPPASTAAEREDPRLRVGALLGYHADGTPVASAYVRLLLPLTHPSVQQRLRFRAIDLDAVAAGWPQILIVQRTAAPDPATARRIIDLCRAQDIRLVLEIDDDLFALRRSWRRPGGFPANAIAALREIAREADTVVVSTPPLQAVLQRWNSNVRIVPNALDEYLWFDGEAVPEVPPAAAVEPPIRILYQGTRMHAADIALVADALKRIRADYDGDVEIELIGGLPTARADLEQAFNAVLRDAPEPYPELVAWMHAHRRRWHIGICPLVDTPFNRSKSYLKFLDYSALGLAVACSDVETYRDVARHERNALRVPNSTDAWYQAIRRLIDDPVLRERLRQQAFKDLREGYLLEQRARHYADALSVTCRPTATEPACTHANPTRGFDELRYLAVHPDVAGLVAAGRCASARQHWLTTGRIEIALGLRGE